MRTTRAPRGLALAVAALALLGCTGDEGAEPAPTTRATTSTSAVDYSGVALAGVPGETTSTVVENGRARIGGAVQGPDGLIPGATVRIERLVAGREIVTEVVTGADGRYLVEGVPGGRYRLRAYLAPSLAQLEPEVRFLADAADHDIPLVVEAQGGVVVTADVAPEPPMLGRAVNLVVQVVSRRVDPDGIVRSAPVVGATVELAGLGSWVLRDDRAPVEEDEDDEDDEEESTTSSTLPSISTSTTRPAPRSDARTDSGGRVRFELRCHTPGDPGLALRVPVRSATAPGADATTHTSEPQVTMRAFPLEIPPCIDPATTTTVAPSTTAPTTTAPQ